MMVPPYIYPCMQCPLIFWPMNLVKIKVDDSYQVFVSVPLAGHKHVINYGTHKHLRAHQPDHFLCSAGSMCVNDIHMEAITIVYFLVPATQVSALAYAIREKNWCGLNVLTQHILVQTCIIRPTYTHEPKNWLGKHSQDLFIYFWGGGKDPLGIGLPPPPPPGLACVSLKCDCTCTSPLPPLKLWHMTFDIWHRKILE